MSTKNRKKYDVHFCIPWAIIFPYGLNKYIFKRIETSSANLVCLEFSLRNQGSLHTHFAD